MTLRARLALLYTSIVGGILLLFSTAVYLAASLTLLSQVNQTLIDTANRVVAISWVTSKGELDVSPLQTSLFLTRDVFIQVWDSDGNWINTSPNIGWLDQPLDPLSQFATRNVFRDVTVAEAHVRVLTVPLVVAGSNRQVGTLQVGTSLETVDATQNTLRVVLLGGSLITMLVSALAAWFSTAQAISPLEAVTQTALQITRADDLSRRIPYQGPPGDEVGQLIRAFNQTLERLEKLFNSQRRFLADVGHEFRTPLTVIKGNVSLMRRYGADEESFDTIENEVDRLTRLVGDLLLLAQAEAGKLPMAQNVIELDTLMLEVLQQMRVLANERVQVRLGEIDQAQVCGDADRLKQVLVNLISNAIKYTPPGGEVTVSLSKEEDRARLTVADNGPGIPAEDLPHIFERFYRGEKSRTRSPDGKGFGLGLSIAYWIVHNHGGQIEARLREPHGTIFYVWLPLLAETQCQAEAVAVI